MARRKKQSAFAVEQFAMTADEIEEHIAALHDSIANHQRWLDTAIAALARVRGEQTGAN